MSTYFQHLLKTGNFANKLTLREDHDVCYTTALLKDRDNPSENRVHKTAKILINNWTPGRWKRGHLKEVYKENVPLAPFLELVIDRTFQYERYFYETNLEQYLEEEIELKNAADCLNQIVEGMIYLHCKNIFHGNLKPSHIFVEKQNKVRIADYGLPPRQVKNQCSLGYAVRGTFEYCAPEMLEYMMIGRSENKVTEKCDCYSYGAICWRVLYSHQPFLEHSEHRIVERIIKGDVFPPSTNALPESFKVLLESCWSIHPQFRPSFVTIKELQENAIVSFNKSEVQWDKVRKEVQSELRKQEYRCMREECRKIEKEHQERFEEQSKEISDLKHKVRNLELFISTKLQALGTNPQNRRARRPMLVVIVNDQSAVDGIIRMIIKMDTETGNAECNVQDEFQKKVTQIVSDRKLVRSQYGPNFSERKFNEVICSSSAVMIKLGNDEENATEMVSKIINNNLCNTIKPENLQSEYGIHVQTRTLSLVIVAAFPKEYISYRQITQFPYKMIFVAKKDLAGLKEDEREAVDEAFRTWTSESPRPSTFWLFSH